MDIDVSEEDHAFIPPTMTTPTTTPPSKTLSTISNSTVQSNTFTKNAATAALFQQCFPHTRGESVTSMASFATSSSQMLPDQPSTASAAVRSTHVDGSTRNDLTAALIQTASRRICHSTTTIHSSEASTVAMDEDDDDDDECMIIESRSTPSLSLHQNPTRFARQPFTPSTSTTTGKISQSSLSSSTATADSSMNWRRKDGPQNQNQTGPVSSTQFGLTPSQLQLALQTRGHLTNRSGWLTFSTKDCSTESASSAQSILSSSSGASNSATIDLATFLTKHPPSSTSNRELAWICCRQPRLEPRNQVAGAEEDPDLMEIMMHEWASAPVKNAAIVEKLARTYRILGGKWMIFSRPDRVDQHWRQITTALYSGQLSVSTVKVSTAKPPSTSEPDNHVFCLYTSDFTNLSEVKLVREQLRTIGFSHQLNYKADIYTEFGIYRDNPWKIKPTILTM